MADHWLLQFGLRSFVSKSYDGTFSDNGFTSFYELRCCRGLFVAIEVYYFIQKDVNDNNGADGSYKVLVDVRFHEKGCPRPSSSA